MLKEQWLELSTFDALDEGKNENMPGIRTIGNLTKSEPMRYSSNRFASTDMKKKPCQKASQETETIET
jgi:hypothetical protein